MIVVAEKFVKIITCGFARAITLWPFILLRNKEDVDNKVLLNHEMIHIEQQKELFVIGFYIWYLIEYVINRVKYKSHVMAYRNISFELEATRHEWDKYYLQRRKRYNFIKLL